MFGYLGTVIGVLALVITVAPRPVRVLNAALEKAVVKITKDTAVAWDPEIQNRVVSDMADGVPSKGLQPPTLLASRVPNYPQSARKTGLQGVATVEARVGVKGRVEEFAVAKGEPVFVEALKAAVSSWRYRPLTIDGVRHELRIVVEASFTLQ